MLVVVGTACLLVALVGGWVRTTVLDAGTFADRATTLLESPTTRQRLATSLTDQIIASGPGELTSYRPVLLVAVDATLATDAFQRVFREAVRTAHRSVLESGGQQQVLDLAASVRVLQDIVGTTNPELAAAIPSAPTAFLVDVTDQVRAVGVGGWASAVDRAWWVALGLGVAAYAGALALSPRRRDTFTWAGAGWVVDGGLVVLATTITPGIIAGTIDDPLLAATSRELAERTLADLQSLGYWVVGYGVLLVAVANARQHLAERTTARRALERAWGLVTRRPRGPAGQAGRAVALVLAGIVVVRWSGQVATLAVAVTGMVVAYFGLVELVRILGQGAPTPAARQAAAPAPAGAAGAGRDARATAGRTWVALGAVGVIGLVALSTGAALTVGGARARATVDERCNGSAELCEKRLDEVAFAGTHNSMSALHEPGWLFAAQTGGIPAQLEAGVRALLIDTHYGVRSTLPAPGTDRALVLTDRAASVAAGLRPAPAPVDDETSPSADARAQDLAATAPRAPGAVPEPYLCHNWCELGATPLVDALAAIRRFVEVHPNEVVLLLVEDYVSPADTQAAFARSGLLPHTWALDLDRPLPTLGEMVDAGRTVVVAAQQAGPPPAWYLHTDDLVQDTSFRYRTVEELAGDCAPNRGDADAPLLLANHWLDTGTPNPADARLANAADVLEERVARCAEERGRAPNVIAVDWYATGDLLAVVDRLNGVA